MDEATGCWVWQRAASSHPKRPTYGVTSHNGRQVLAHRHYYQLHNGPIPKGREIHHRCRNGLCVNPDHLQMLTATEHAHLERNTRLTPKQVSEIKRLLVEGRQSQRGIARRFGVGKTLVYHINAGHNWASVPWPSAD